MNRSKSGSWIAVIAMVACICALAFAAGCSSAPAGSSASGASGASASASSTSGDPYATGVHHATLTVEGYDPIAIELDADAAPITVANFCKLANEGFYDGLTFYRFVDGFCMQGGSSNNSAAVVDDGIEPIKGEFAQNGVENPLADKFVKGTVAMARSSDPNSATSTFFVTLATSQGVSSALDGQYAAFGKIDATGMKVVDQVVADHLENVDDAQSGSISDVAKQAKIASIVIDD